MSTSYILSFKACPHCGGKVTLRRHPACDDRDWPAIESFTCCNRCADHHNARNKTTDAIFKVCASAYCAQLTRTQSRDDAQRSRDALNILTKRLATIECDFYGVQNFWEDSFPSLLFERPDKSGNILADYTRRIKEAGQPET